MLIASAVINPILNAVVKPQITESLNKNESVQLNIGGIEYSLFQNKLILFNSSLSIKDSLSKEDNLNIFLPVVSVNGINWLKLMGEGYSFGDIIVNKPRIKIEQNVNSDSTSSQDDNKSDLTPAESIVNLIPENLLPLKISSIKINSASIVNKIKDETIDSIKNLSLNIEDIFIEEKRNSVFEEIELSIKNLYKKFPDGGYYLTVESINLSSGNSELIIRDFEFLPFISDEEFFKGDIFRADRWIAKLPEIKLEEVDVIKFFNENLLEVKKISIPDFHTEIFTNRRLPVDSNARPEMPHEIISSLDFKLNVEEFKTTNSVLILESVMPKVERRAQLQFTNMQASIKNISNIIEKQNNETPCLIYGSCYFMKEGLLQINLRYNLLSDNLDFIYKGSIDGMDLTLINSHLEVEDKTEIKSGKIIKANFSTEVNDGISKVNLIPLYKDLKIEILEEESIEDLWLPTFIANIKIRESNPDEDGSIKSANVNYKRKTTDTFMDVIWLAILEGIAEVVGF